MVALYSLLNVKPVCTINIKYVRRLRVNEQHFVFRLYKYYTPECLVLKFFFQRVYLCYFLRQGMDIV